MKKALLAAAVAVALLVVADYAGVLGTRAIEMNDIMHLRVKPVDRNSGQVVTDVHVTCVRRGSEEACSQKTQAADGVLTLNFIVGKTAVYTRLFKFRKSEKLKLDETGEMVLVFIQPNYERLFLVVKTPDIVAWGDEVKVVPLDPSEEGMS